MIKKRSIFEHPQYQDWLEQWVNKTEEINGYKYDRLRIKTSLGETQIYGLNTKSQDFKTLVIFPGFRTTSLVWDLDKGLKSISEGIRIFMIETNGQPNLSDGNSPTIKNDDYGKWAKEIFDELGIDSAYIAGASFGGLVCMKAARVMPDRIKAAFLLNPGCLTPFSLAPKNLYYNLLPIIVPKRKNIVKFLDQCIFHKPEHTLNPELEKHWVDYLEYVLKYYKDKTEKPYFMKDELGDVKVKTYLLIGIHDTLFPYQKSIANAKNHLKKNLKEIIEFETGHGIETYVPALKKMKEFILRN